MTITDERKENMSVTIPYMENRQVLIVKSADKDKYSASLEGAKVVAEAGSAGEELATENDDFKDAQFTAVDSQAKALMDVASGVSDVAVIDYIMSLASVGEGTDYTDLSIIDCNFPNESYGAAFRKGSDVTEKVNEAIKELNKDGTLKTIAEKYKLEDLITVE
jgi:polar amino acid transport system substrate-binding protein